MPWAGANPGVRAGFDYENYKKYLNLEIKKATRGAEGGVGRVY